MPRVAELVLVMVPAGWRAASAPSRSCIHMRLALAALWYERGIVSQGMAVRIADLPRDEFMKAISLLSVSPFQESIADIQSALRD